MQLKIFFKSTILLAVLISSSVVYAQQQQRKTPEERAQNQIAWMQQNLNLTKDQNTKSYDILIAHARGMDQARSSGTGNLREQMQDLNVKKDNDIKLVLTPDQFQKYQQHEAEMKQQMQQRRGSQQGGGMQQGGQ